MARDFNGSSQYLQGSQDFSAYSALCVGLWLNADSWGTSAGQFNMLAELTADGASNAGGFAVYNSGNPPEGLTVAHRGATGVANAYFGSRPATGGWTHLLFSGDFGQSSAEVNLYQDGVLLTAAARPSDTNNTGSTYANSTLNVCARNAASLFFDGKIAELAMWNATFAQSADVAAQLAKGVAPSLVAPNLLVRYWPLVGRASPEPDLRTGAGLTATGATAADHPRVYRPGKRRAVFVPAGGGGTFNPAWARGSNVVIGGAF